MMESNDVMRVWGLTFFATLGLLATVLLLIAALIRRRDALLRQRAAAEAVTTQTYLFEDFVKQSVIDDYQIMILCGVADLTSSERAWLERVWRAQHPHIPLVLLNQAHIGVIDVGIAEVDRKQAPPIRPDPATMG